MRLAARNIPPSIRYGPVLWSGFTKVAGMRNLLLCCLILFPHSLAAAQKCPVPKTLTFHVQEEIRRDVVGFTEGLEVHDGAIYESTGKFLSDTRINRINSRTGQVSVVINAGSSYFGEGLTFFAGRLYQLSYRERRVFVFDKNGRRIKELSNPREGWGLTHDRQHLIASDGSNRLYFLSPDDFSTKKVLAVFNQAKPVKNLNELEHAQGAIWANIFGEWNVVRISPVTGCIEARADLEPLRAYMSAADRRAIAANDNFVPNGIAYNQANGTFAVTGKHWPMLYIGRFFEIK
jgi:glutamine cyclotransferase